MSLILLCLLGMLMCVYMHVRKLKSHPFLSIRSNGKNNKHIVIIFSLSRFFSGQKIPSLSIKQLSLKSSHFVVFINFQHPYNIIFSFFLSHKSSITSINYFFSFYFYISWCLWGVWVLSIYHFESSFCEGVVFILFYWKNKK